MGNDGRNSTCVKANGRMKPASFRVHVLVTLLYKYFVLLLIDSKKFSLLGYDALLAACFTLDYCLAYYPNLKMEATRSFKTSLDFHRTARRYIPEDRIIHNHR
jgi:hypothetical protein